MATESRQLIREPPHSLNCEAAIIGGLLADGKAWDRVAGLVGADDFYTWSHRELFATIAALEREGAAADTVVLAETLHNNGTLARVGGMEYLIELAQSGLSANIEKYAGIVRDKAQERELIAAGNSVLEIAYGPGKTREKIDRAQGAVMAVTEARQGSGPVWAGDALPEVWNGLQERIANGRPRGLASGIADLDRLTGGFAAGDLVVIAGRPSMGKTALAQQIALAFAARNQTAIFFSLEMARTALLERAMATYALVNQEKVRDAKLAAGDIARLSAAQDIIAKLPYHIDDTPDITVDEIKARARSLTRKQHVDIIVVDYLQLMDGIGENRNQEIESITRALKATAKELGCVVLALSQLSRQCELRADKRPMLADLRESGGIEQDSDTVVMVYRDDYYSPATHLAGIAELLLRKQRNGPVGTVYAKWIAQYLRFETLAGPPPSAPQSRRRSFKDD